MLSIFALASSEWGIARFTTDSFALIALTILVGLPILLLKDQTNIPKLWTKENAFSNR